MWYKAKLSARVDPHTAVELQRLASRLRLPLADVVAAAIVTSTAEPHRMLHHLSVADPDALVGAPEHRHPLPPAPPLGRIGRAWQAFRRFDRG